MERFKNEEARAAFQMRAADAAARYEASLAAEKVGYRYPAGSPERARCFAIARLALEAELRGDKQ